MRITTRTTRTLALTATVLAAAVVIAPPVPASAATFDVTTADDSGPGSLRAAIEAANTSPGPDVITIAPGLGPIQVLSTLEITEAVSILGPGPDAAEVVQATYDDLFRLAVPAAADISMSGFTVTGLRPTSDNSGQTPGFGITATLPVLELDLTTMLFQGFGAIDNNGQTQGGAVHLPEVVLLRIEDSRFVGNMSDQGGAVSVGLIAGAEIVRSEFRENRAPRGGGAVRIGSVTDAVHVDLSTFIDNLSGTAGGGILVESVPAGATATIERSTFWGNRGGFAPGLRSGETATGAAVHFDTVEGLALVHSSTFTGQYRVFSDSRVAEPYGLSIGAGQIASGGVVRVIDSTLDEFASDYFFWAIAVGQIDAGGLLDVGYTTITSRGGIIVLNNQGAVAVTSTILDNRGTLHPLEVRAGAAASVDWSVITGPENPAWIASGAGNQFDVPDTVLGELADNGGPTWTRMLLPGSPAIATGDPLVATQPELEQRNTGYPRVLCRIDVGAVEINECPPIEPIVSPELPELPATGATVPGAGVLLASSAVVLGALLVFWAAARWRRRTASP